MASKHVKRCLTLVDIREMPIKNIMNYCKPIRTTKIKTATTPNVHQDDILSGHVTRYRYSRKPCVSFLQ